MTSQKGPIVSTAKAEIKRRSLLQGAAGLIVAAMGASSMNDTVNAAETTTGKIIGKGVGDFDFLTGEWTIKNRRLKNGSTIVWEEFAGAATVHRLMGGMASIEELRIPANNYRGMGVRVWHSQEKLWADHWTGAYNGVVNPPQLGQFIGGEGIFISDDEMDGKPIKARGVWDRITPNSCRWHQSTSADGGKTWDYNWYMDWTRVGKP
jgi:hypothetical protein